MDRGVLQKLYWIDTRDMLADGLNKGSVKRIGTRRVDAHAALGSLEFEAIAVVAIYVKNVCRSLRQSVTAACGEHRAGRKLTASAVFGEVER